MLAPLRSVAMRRPGAALLGADPDVWHYSGPLDAERLTCQYDALVALVTKSGAEIVWIPPAADGLS